MPARARSRREHSAGGVVFRRDPAGPRYLLILDGHGNWGFPKGHLDRGETALDAARREVAEETGVDDLVLYGELGEIDWYFRTRDAVVHKYCEYFLFESPGATPRPQTDEGITDCQWFALPDAMERTTYENSRVILRRAAERVAELTGSPDGHR
jgi:8-oxo-dGTP pyrophosphatase MutT (NUDIX family)